MREFQVADQLVLGGVRQGVGRRREHRHQERHEHDLAGNAFFFFRDDGAQREGATSRDSTRPGNARRPATRRRSAQKQFGGTFGGPLERDRTFFFVSFERLDVDDEQLRHHRRSRRRIRRSVSRLGTPPEILRARRIPGRDRQRALRGRVQPVPAQGRSPDHGEPAACAVRFNCADALNENIEPWGGLVARSRGAVARQHATTCSPPRTLAILGVAGSSTSCASSSRSRDQEVNSLDPDCGGPCDAEDEGGPTLEMTGVASVGRQRFTPQPRRNDALSDPRHVQLFTRRPPVEGGLRLQLRRPQGAGAAAALRRPLHLSRRSRRSRASLPAPDHRDSGARARPAGRLRPGLRQLVGDLRVHAICRSSRRTTGASTATSR